MYIIPETITTVNIGVITALIILKIDENSKYLNPYLNIVPKILATCWNPAITIHIITKTIAVLKKLLVLSCAISFILLTGVLKIPEKKFLAFFVSSLTSTFLKESFT